MRRNRFSTAAILAASVIAVGWTVPANMSFANESHRLTGPYTHDNLAIYLIHRESSDWRSVPLILEEAMQQGVVEVSETGDVQELVIRNLAELEVFIQSGDIVKGGKQDRVLVVSMILPPNSGDIPVGAFCVEQGRWSRRGQEEQTHFSESTARLPSQDGRQAIAERLRGMVAPEDDVAAPPTRGRRQLPQGESLQEQVWDSVGEMQLRLSRSVGPDVYHKRSPSSLQLSLESKALDAALRDRETALGTLPKEHPGAVGYVFAINGKINGGDEFGSPILFRKLWPRQLKAVSTEAIAEKRAQTGRHPTLAEVAEFLDGARAGEPVVTTMPGRMNLEMRETDQALYTEIRRRNGRWVHRSFVAYH